MSDWSDPVFEALQARGIRTIATVPDGGLTTLLQRCTQDADMRVVTLTTEEEGVGLCVGAWLGGQRSILMMQSSGSGNCINALSFPVNLAAPCLMLVTMRGEWGEFNPWQVPMGQAVQPAFEAMGVTCFRVERAEAVGETFAAAADMAFNCRLPVAVLVAQRVIGAKEFKK